jgi:cytochrome P450
VLSFSAMLLIAGHETTTNLIGNALLALLRNPAELAKVRSHLVSVPGVIEETLRYDAPVQLVRRQATHDVTLGGITIPAKALVMPCLGSANRDEEQFPNPDRFDVERNPQSHLAFGFGPHFCVGVALARLEAKIALEAVLSRLSALGLVPERERDTLSESLFVRGPKHLFVTFEPT